MPFVSPFSLVQVKDSFVFILFSKKEFPMFVLHPGLWVKKCNQNEASNGDVILAVQSICFVQNLF